MGNRPSGSDCCPLSVVCCLLNPTLYTLHTNPYTTPTAKSLELYRETKTKTKDMEHQGEIILYQPNQEVKLEVRLENETVWLNRLQLAELFARDVKTIGKHINNALREELADMSTVAKFAIVQSEGGRSVTRQVEFYNLDMILSVGYRVKSNRAITDLL